MFYIGTLFKVRFTQDSGLGRCVLSSFFEGLDTRGVKVVDILTTSLIFLHEFSFLCDLPCSVIAHLMLNKNQSINQTFSVLLKVVLNTQNLSSKILLLVYNLYGMKIVTQWILYSMVILGRKEKWPDKTNDRVFKINNPVLQWFAYYCYLKKFYWKKLLSLCNPLVFM